MASVQEPLKPVYPPEWAPWWICFEAGRKGSPWVLRSYRASRPDTRQRGYYGLKSAVRRLGRLRPLWVKWTFLATLRLIPEPLLETGFTEAEYLAAWRQQELRRRVRLDLLGVRRLAVQCGLDPDDVAYQRGDRLYPGRLLLANGPQIERLLERAELPHGGHPNVPQVTVGQRFQPLDSRRKRSFTILRIEGDRVVADDGRSVAVGRLLTRYRPVP